MAKKRISLYVDEALYNDVQALLRQADPPGTMSGLFEVLMSDWHFNAKIAPMLPDMSPDERESVLSKLAVKQFIDLANEVEQTLNKARFGGDTT